MYLQTLVFNTTTRNVKLYEGQAEASQILYQFENIPTVKPIERFYEIIAEIQTVEGAKRIPVARFPIENTNMLILK